MNTRRLILLLLSVSVFVFNTKADVSLASPSGISKVRQDYVYDLLTSALNAKQPSKKPINVKAIPTNIGYSASTFAVQSNSVDVAFFPTNNEVEQRLHPIRVPLYKGLMGYRLLVIRSDEQARFSAVSSLEQLKQITQGAGSRWRTTQILKYHGFDFLTAARTSSLLKMLEKDRFDYTTRGVIEAPETLTLLKTKHSDLKIENNILLVTDLPVYFFVAKQNEQLAKQISDGLLHIAKSGKFDEIFNRFMLQIPQQMNLDKRVQYHLGNPYLSPASRKNAQLFWQHEINRPINF